MTPEAGLVASRFVHIAALTILFGASLFQFYAPAQPRMRASLVFSALLAILSGLTWFALTAANMRGDIAAATDIATLSATFGTSFGQVWLWHMAFVAALLAIVVMRRRGADAFGFVELLVAASALATMALTGHTRMYEGFNQRIHTLGDAAHLLAAGAWLGGLFALLLLLREARNGASSEQDAASALVRFSPIGYVVVAVLAFTGTINTVYLIKPLEAIFTTAYGQLLLIKLALVAFMLVLAAINRFVLVPRLVAEAARAGALARFRRQVALEQTAGLAILAIVAILGMTEPPMAMVP